MPPVIPKPLRNKIWVWLAVAIASTLLWQAVGATTKGRLLVSQPSLVMQYAQAHTGDLLRSACYTGIEALLAMAAATIFALLFALSAVYLPRLAQFLYPWLVASQVVPFVCLAPLVILMFGPGPEGKVFLSTLMSFFPIVANVLTGMKEVPGPPLELMRMMHSQKQMIVRHVFVPYCLPYFYAGLRVAAPLAVIGAIVAEFNGAEYGVGKDIFISAKRLEPELMMLSILAGSLLSAFLYSIPVISEKSLGQWYQNKNHK